MAHKFLDVLREYLSEEPDMADLPTLPLTTSVQQFRQSQQSLHNRCVCVCVSSVLYNCCLLVRISVCVLYLRHIVKLFANISV